MSRDRVFHAATFAVAAFAVVLQFVLVYQGHGVLDETSRPDRGTRVVRFFSYLTIWGNVLVAWSSAALALGRDRDTPWARALRLDSVVLIAVIAVVHFVLLRPLLDLDGADYLADKLLHMVVPAVAVAAWLLLGPRGRASWSDLGRFLVIPVGWLVYTLVRGEVVEWYPYPFIDVNEHGYGPVLVACVGVSALMIGVLAGVIRLDRRLSR